MKIRRITKAFIVMFSILIISSTATFSQCIPYLGQSFPGNTPMRLVPDSMVANAEWQYHGTPTFSPDGNEMYYAIYRFDPGRIEIWYTECVNGVWISPKKAPFSDDSYSNNNPYFSRNKDTLFFFSDRPYGPIFKVTRTNSIWSSPLSLNIRIPIGYNTGWQFSIADNGNIYAELSKSGQEDIFVWRFVSGLYRSAEKMSSICSPELDFTPFIDPAERFIIFASRRLGGLGNTDIYISKKNSDGTWETPINLGAIINSGYVISPIISRDGKYFFFEAWMPDAAGGNPYWVDANLIYNLITDIKYQEKTPIGFNLYQNYPNPFNPSTIISFSIPNQTNVKISVYNSIGEEVAELLNEIITAGNHQVTFDATNFSSGLYFYRITAGNTSNGTTQGFVDVKKMLLLK